ncbi:hypothetical protein P6709_15310 [Jeotgalibacillus sp. ET6]|uniref:hypothetical protein n=1 Tax=Jeotgalibacillus sp. ET6 TaxID=3037260 RepID=UPI0024183BED|nr:hypothetical protein [Jeotgalibacillus sp. ET6]MDG5473120.1 hypothetical protein [Jeotgalibacillus sp. ET6]
MAYKNATALLEENKNIDELVKYDFKHERGIYKKEENIDLWLEYRNEGKKWDCDGSGNNGTRTCELTRDIYKVLWEWNSDKENRYKSTCYFRAMLMGPDTMNSFFNVITQVIQVVNLNGKIEYFKQIKGKRHWSKLDTRQEEFLNLVKYVLENNEIGPLLKEYVRLTHTIGNFILVPKGFNGRRAIKTSDYWDLSLQLMQLDKTWLQGESFKKYVNTFFLWDYVDEKYEVKSFFSGHSLQNKKPATINECVEMLKTITSAIERRGYFMIAMLRAAIEDPKQYKEIMKQIINLDKSNMESAVQIIRREINQDEKILAVLNKIYTKKEIQV